MPVEHCVDDMIGAERKNNVYVWVRICGGSLRIFAAGECGAPDLHRRPKCGPFWALALTSKVFLQQHMTISMTGRRRCVIRDALRTMLAQKQPEPSQFGHSLGKAAGCVLHALGRDAEQPSFAHFPAGSTSIERR